MTRLALLCLLLLTPPAPAMLSPRGESTPPIHRPEPTSPLILKMDEDSEVWLDGQFYSWGEVPEGDVEITGLHIIAQWIIKIEYRTKIKPKESQP